jgi:two-component system NtrC family response regulator
MSKRKLLIIEDDEDIRTQMKWALAADYEVVVAGDQTSAHTAFAAHRPVVTLLDLGLPPRPNDLEVGMATLGSLLTLDPLAKVIIVSGQGERQNAIRAVGMGAYDFLVKPVDMDELRLVLQRCVYLAELEQEFRSLQQTRTVESFEGMIGSSPQMQSVFSFIRKVAPTSAPVLILGESGTGKEMVAQAIHRRGAQKGGPFVPINCNAIPENLLESELFGHERGAFTGAHAMRKGHIETAANGTLFLDEIGELPAAVQVKLLRYLQEKRFQRVGGRQEIHSDARVIAATNVELEAAVAKGTFREDLYFRLAVVVLKVPTLRERGDDISAMAKEFLRQFGSQHGRAALTFSADAVAAINTHQWPGNVRELQNRIQRAVILAEGKKVRDVDLELNVPDKVVNPTLRDVREAAERETIQAALRRNAGSITATSAELGISRPTLYELMEKLGIHRG